MQTQETAAATIRTVAPLVDIIETPEGLVLQADMPGVEANDLGVNVENGTLTIRGTVATASTPSTYAEFERVEFFRQFELGESIETTKITADLSNGVLTLYMPKVERAKPRAIQINVN